MAVVILTPLANYILAQNMCGDVNHDQTINILDITFIISYLYDNGPGPEPADLGDVNADGDINIIDISYLITYIYQFGPEPDCDYTSPGLTYPIVGTDQDFYYNSLYEIACPSHGQAFCGQDAATGGKQPVSYTDNGDGTVTDNITGLTWQKYIDEKLTFVEAVGDYPCQLNRNDGSIHRLRLFRSRLWLDGSAPRLAQLSAYGCPLRRGSAK
jgi:hypothetical protein